MCDAKNRICSSFYVWKLWSALNLRIEDTAFEIHKI